MKTHTKYEDTDETFWEMSAAYGERDKCMYNSVRQNWQGRASEKKEKGMTDAL